MARLPRPAADRQDVVGAAYRGAEPGVSITVDLQVPRNPRQQGQAAACGVGNTVDSVTL